MLAKKSAFDILMNKNKLKEKQALTSDSDSDIIIIKNVKSTTNSRKSPEKENSINNSNATNVNISNRQKAEPLDIQSLFVSLDTAFTIAPHTNQLAQIDFEFLHSFNHSNLVFKPKCTFDVNSIELNRPILKLEYHEKLSQSKQRNTKKKRQSKKKEDEEVEEKVDSTNRVVRGDNYELWTEKYMFTSENDIVTNTGQFERLKEWLKNWKSILSNEDTKNSKEKSYDSGSEYSYESDASNADSVYSTKKKFYSNAILLSGPHGCGKTSSVHVVAKHLGFKIFEVNSSSLRCKTQIIQELEGAMNSHHVSSNATNSSKSSEIANMFGGKNNLSKVTNNDTANFKLEKFFKSQQQTEKAKPAEPKTRNKKRKISLRKETVLSIHNKTRRRSKKYKKDEEESETDDIEEDEATQVNDVNTNLPTSEESSVNIHKESLILFDEVDVVFREDVGFLAAINYFIKKSKKPIILTTNDDFLQEKINLNIERIIFVRPRVDAAIKYLKKVSKQENFELDTPTGYKIIGDCKCDMRRALLQLQTLVNSSHTGDVSLVQLNLDDDTSTDLNSYIPNWLTSQQESYFDNFFYLDKLTKELKANELNSNNESNFKKYDLVLLKDGLSDNSVCSNVSVFNPFLPINSINNNTTHDFSNDATSHHLLAYDLYTEYMRLFNKNSSSMDFNEWSKHGLADHFNYSSNAAINKFAQATFKSTTSKAVSLEYRPFLQIICQTEEKNQAKNSTKRRYLHYLHYSNMGLAKEDFQLLAKSNLTCVDSAKAAAIINSTTSDTARNDEIFSSENI